MNLEIAQGDFIALIGKNGAGKTSLIDLIMGFRWPDSGTVKIFGESIRTRKKDYLMNISYLAHDVQMAGGQTIESFLNFHSFFYPDYSKRTEKELLNNFSVDPLKEISALSTGQQKKIQIIAALSSGTKIIVIDEITAVLDYETRSLLFKKLKESVEQQGKTIVIATNLIEDLSGTVNRTFEIDPVIQKGIPNED